MVTHKKPYPTVEVFIQKLQSIIPLLHQKYPELYENDFIVKTTTRFELIRHLSGEFNDRWHVHHRVERLNGYTVEEAYERLFLDVNFWLEHVYGWDDDKMWWNNLGIANHKNPYKHRANIRCVCMYNN